MNCGLLWVTFGSLFAYEGDFAATLGSLRHRFWHVKATLGHFGITFRIWWWLRGNFGVILRSPFDIWGRLWVHFWSLWGYFGSTCGTWEWLWSHFWVTLGSVWGQCCCLWVTLRHLMVTLQSLWSHFGYTKVRFQKTFIFHTDFNDFINLLGEIWVDLGLLWDHFWHMEVTLGPLWGHFGATLGI